MKGSPATFNNEFYVTLPSNASMHFYPNNIACSFVVKLAHPIQLRGKWEVGLAEITYPHTWNTLAQSVSIYFEWTDESGYTEFDSLQLEPNNYPTVHHLLGAIAHLTPMTFRSKIRFHYDRNKRRVVVNVGPNCTLKMPDESLAMALGFDFKIQSKLEGDGEYYASTTPDMQVGVYGMFLYTDLITPVPVGDSVVPLLRIVEMAGEDGDIVTKTYDKPHYIPVRNDHFEGIEIHISDDQGQLIRFTYGKVVVKLHFRPRRLQYM